MVVQILLPERYPETVIIFITHTGVEGKIALRACVFLPHHDQYGVFLSFVKSFEFEAFAFIILWVQAPFCPESPGFSTTYMV